MAVRVRGAPQPVPLKEVDFPLSVVLRQEVKNGGWWALDSRREAFPSPGLPTLCSGL